MSRNSNLVKEFHSKSFFCLQIVHRNNLYGNYRTSSSNDKDFTNKKNPRHN